MEKQKTMQFIQKMKEARQLEGEAFLALFPDHMKKHLDVIGTEVKAMLREFGKEHKPEQKPVSKVKKVDIS